MIKIPMEVAENLKKNDRLMFDEIFETNMYNVLEEEIKGKNILDIGANIGYFSILVSYLSPAKILAVEPLCEAYAWLFYNTLYINNMRTIKLIVAGKDNEIKRIYNPGPDMNVDYTHASNIFNEEKGEIVETISLKTLLTKFEDNNDVVIKIDTEGAEYDILLNTSFEDMIRVSTIYIEIHSRMNPNLEYRGYDIIENKIRSFGFECVYKPAMSSFDGWDENSNRINIHPATEFIQVEKWSRK
jgi:FkbM family methyltransferase